MLNSDKESTQKDGQSNPQGKPGTATNAAAKVTDLLNPHYRDNFPALKLSAKAMAIANGAKAKNSRRKEELLKIAEETSRKTLDQHKQKAAQKQ